ncbi:serine hydrolase [Microbacterium lacticum]|uniref:serine hydrolase n=1 Tax=Microbacterium lacticum TaxID=33885 RepID=UPI00242EA99E|nr:serine hydrolase [Microbacterium lacticum]
MRSELRRAPVRRGDRRRRASPAIGAVSDNAATNTLARVIGLPVVQEHTRALGYTASGLDDIVRWPLPPGAPRTLSHATALPRTRRAGRPREAAPVGSEATFEEPHP